MNVGSGRPEPEIRLHEHLSTGAACIRANAAPPCITEAGASARFRRLAPSLRLLLLLSTAPGYSSGLLAHLALGVYMPDADTLSEALRPAKHISDLKSQLV